MIDQVRVQVAFLPGIHIHGRDSESGDATIVVIPVYIPCNSGRTYPRPLTGV